ncbi:MAG: MBG domain-containing protein, partial [Candidatus Omnitrophota bacterium]
IAANDATKTYGETATFAGTEFTSAGLVNGDTVTSVTLTSAGAVNTASVGTYAIAPSAAAGAGLSNYAITYVNGTLTVNPTTLFANGKVIKNFEWPIQEILRSVRFTTRDSFIPVATGSGLYFYHPLTPTDTAAFDSMFTLGEDAYSFMNGKININGHDGLLPILSGIKK